jgi:hypothetical protein
VTDPLTPEDVLRYLKDVDYPAGKEALVDAAERAGAPEVVIRSLRAIPPVDYRSRAEVLRSAAVKEELPPSQHAARARDRKHQRIAERLREPHPDSG